MKGNRWMVLPAALGAVFLAAVAAPAGEAPPSLGDYVQQVGERVLRAQSDVGGLPRSFRVREADGLAAGLAEPGVIEVTTGLLLALENEAQLANVLAYEQARTARPERREARGTGTGTRIAQAAAAGAAVAAVAAGIYEAFEHEDRIVRAAATGGASAATAALVYAAWPRRQGYSEARWDDRSARQGMRAVVTAGYDGRAALEAWSRVTSAAPMGGPEGGYGDPKADRKRQRAQAELLRDARGKTSGDVGREAYRAAVLDRLR